MAIRTSNIILIYFVIAAVMFGGGAITWDDSGPTKFFINQGTDDDQFSPNEQTESELEGVSGAITSLIGSFGGPVILVWNLFAGLVGFIHWPLFVMFENNVPPRVTILLGGSLTAMFYMSVIRLVRSSA